MVTNRPLKSRPRRLSSQDPDNKTTAPESNSSGGGPPAALEDSFYRLIAENARDGIWLSDSSGVINFANEAIAGMLGYDDPSEMVGRSIFDFMNEQARAAAETRLKKRKNGVGERYEFSLVRKDGADLPVEIAANPIFDENGHYSGVLGMVHEITARKQAEMAEERALRAYRTLSAGNQALLRAVDEQSLLNEVCQVIHEVGGYNMAWVGYKIDDEAKTVRPMAWSGIGGDELPGASLTWADTEQGRGPSGAAIRTGRPVVMQNLATDPNFITYRARALALGHGSVAVFPLMHEEQALGVLGIYAAEPEAFDEREIGLLGEMSGDLAYGIQAIRTRSERNRMEATLRESEASFKLMFHANPHPMWAFDVDTLQFLEVNDAAIHGYGFSRDEFLRMKISDIRPEEDVSKLLELVQSDTDPFYATAEWKHRLKNGQIIDVEVVSHAIDFAGHHARLVVAHDVTMHKQAEESIRLAHIALERQNQRLAALYTVGQVVNSTLDVNRILSYLATESMRVTKATHALVLIADPVKGLFERRSMHGFSPDQIRRTEEFQMRLNEGLNGRAYQTRQIVLVDDVRTQPEYRELVEGTLSELVVPIIRQGEVLGNIDLESPEPGAFRGADMDYLKALAEQSALAITNARLFRELESYGEFLEQAVQERTGELLTTKDRVETILSSVGDGLMVLNMDGRIQQVNPAFERQTGFSTAEAEMRDHHALLHLDFGSKGTYQNALEALAPGDVWQGETRVQRKDGAIYDASLTVAPVRNLQGRIHMLVASIRDITPLKEVERAKEEFVSNVSHELRTPITSMRLTRDLIRRDPGRLDVFMQRLDRDIERLNLLIEDLLQLSRLEQDHSELAVEPVDLNALAAQYHDDRAALAESRQLMLKLEPASALPLVEANASLLGQAMSVLLTNAFNYTPAGGVVTISTHQHDDAGQRWAGFSIADNGPGIAPTEQTKLFSRFFRGTVGRASGSPGTGLGLAIAKEIVDRHAARIEVVSDGIPGKGTTFIVWLPVKDGAGDADRRT